MPIFRRFSHKLALAFSLAMILAMAATGLLLTRALKEQMVQDLTASLYTQARLASSESVAGMFLKKESVRLHPLAHRLSRACNCRVTLIHADGQVLGDSEVDFKGLGEVESHLDRPEVRSALKEGRGRAVRHSATVGQDLLYAAVPLLHRGQVVGAVRVAVPLTQVREKTVQIRKTIAWVALWVALAAVAIALWASRSISRPLQEMSEAAERLAKGDYSARVSRLSLDEHGQLGRTLNHLAESLESTVQELFEDKAQFSTILSHMVEAVVAVDAEGRILFVNPALSGLFGAEASSRGRPFSEVIREERLDLVLKSVLRDRKDHREEVKISSPEPRYFQVNAGPLIREGKCVGALLVLHDITRIKMLEQIRKDFVANVSHELRTPVASIKAFAETLRSGALEDPKNRLQFVKIIEKDADRMAKLVDDLLELSAIESGQRVPALEPVDLMGLAREVAGSLGPLAERRKVGIQIRPSGMPNIPADKNQMRQVLTNLMENAVKFSKEDGVVVVSDALNGRYVSVSVRDNGIGIGPQDIPRLFERFYRADKARSREMGGTGLGLAIVKHIVEAHGGSVAVESRPEEGSVFSFSLPRESGS